MGGTTTYDPRKVAISWNGVPLNGFAEGTFIKCTRRSPLSTLGPVGPDGESARNLSGDHSYEIELTVKKGSPANTVLSAAATSDRLGEPVSGPFTVRDPSVGLVFEGEETFIQDSAPVERSPELGTNVWKLVSPNGFEEQPGRI